MNNLDIENLYKTFVETIRSTLEIKTVKQQIVNIIGATLKADRCFLLEYDKMLDDFLDIDVEYLSSNQIGSYIGFDFNRSFPTFSAEFKRGKPLLINGSKGALGGVEFDLNDSIYELEKIATEKSKIYSALVFPIFYKKEFIGDLVVQHVDVHYDIEEDEFNVLEYLASQISVALYQSKLFNEIQVYAAREKLFRNVIESIRSTLNINEIKQMIVDTIGKALSADRCFITEYDNKNNEFLLIQHEYLSSSNIDTCKGINVNSGIPEFAKALKEGKFLLVQNQKIFVNSIEQKDEVAIDLLRRKKVNSMFAVPLYYKREFLGVLSTHYLTQNHIIEQNEIDFLIDIANQTALAIHQANLYKVTELQLAKEKIISDILTKSISTFDLNQIKQIVQEIGLMTKADRCYFVETDAELFRGKPIEYDGEYLSSDNIKTIIGYEFSSDDVKGFIELFRQQNDLIVFDYEKLSEIYDEKNQGIIRYSKLFELKSGVGIPLFYMNNLVAVLAIEYVNEKVIIRGEELEFLRLLGKQMSMVYNQIKLFQDTKKTAEKERLLRKIIEVSRSSFDLNDVIKKLIVEIGTAFKADRCYFRSYSSAIDEFLAPDLEYLSSNNIPNSSNLVLNNEAQKFLLSTISPEGNEFYPIVINEENSKNTPLESYLTAVGIKAAYVVPMINRRQNSVTWLVLHYCNVDPKLEDEDKKLIETICYQADAAFEQIKLYNETKKNAEREALIKNITDKIRSSLDVEETLTFICEETAKLFNVQRVTIVYFYDPSNYENYLIRREYKVDPSYGGLSSSEYSTRAAAYWNSVLTTGKILAFDNIQESDAPDYFKECYAAIGTKSMIGSAIKKGDTQWGSLVLSEYINFRHWSDEEKELLETIALQVYIAINQAELYQKERLAAEREKMSRNIIEILRSSIDKRIIKKLFVKNIGKFFDADRVYFSDFDRKSKMYLPVDADSEYLSSEKVKSYIGFDWSNPAVSSLVRLLLDKREIKIFDWDEYVMQNPNFDQGAKSLFEDANIKSSYNFPVLHQDEIMGYFCIDFTSRVSRLTEEDIGRIRSICTQAGIALYHAELYEKAQQAFFSKQKFISEISDQILTPTKDILKTAEFLSTTKIEDNVQVEYLDSIINSCNQLLELTNKFYAE